MSQVCTNLPTNVVGPLKQTLFLGCSIKSFTSTVGWNEQESSVTVELVEDPCPPAAGSFKYYYPKPGIEKKFTLADPGFQTPTVGAPVYLRIGDFEFAGLVQSWTKNNSPSGNPTYSVNISDPRFILQNLTVIVSEYAGAVGSTYNLINAYGALEATSTDCPQTVVNKALFGSPAGGFGNASTNTAGTPWRKLKNTIQSLLTGNVLPNYSPYGHAVFRGHQPIPADPYANQMGRLIADGYSQQIIQDFNGNGYTSNYLVDISELAGAQQYYRIPGPSVSLLELINQINTDSGSDYYIELLVTSALQKVIKIRTASRRVQPVLGQIEQFVGSTSGVTTKDVGRELRNEPTSVFLYGSKVQTIYEDSSGTLNLDRYWGVDYSGNPILASGTEGTGYFVRVDFRPAQINLTHPLVLDGNAVDFLEVSETELRMALGGIKSLRNYATAFGAEIIGAAPDAVPDLNAPGAGTPLGKALRESFDSFPTTTRDTKVVRDNPEVGPVVGLTNDNVQFLQDDPPLPAQVDGNPKAEDEKIVCDFLKNFAEEYYGKQYLLKLEYICSGYDEDSKSFLYSDQPTSDGGFPFPGTTGVLGLPYPSTGLDTFTDDSSKIKAFAYFPKPTGSGRSMKVTGGTFVQTSGGYYIQCDVDSEKIYTSDGQPAALIKIDNAPTTGNNSALSELEQGILSGIDQPDGLHGTGVKFSGSAWGLMKKAMQYSEGFRFRPSGVAIPMVSNTTRYGPWNYAGPPGPVRFESDDALNPWEYGGYSGMNSGAIEKSKDGMTFMQVGERGSLTVPGYPTKRLGSELRANTNPFGNLTLTQSQTDIGQFQSITLPAMDGTYGPNLTSINVNIGDGGITSTYQFATFTPSFGRLSKLNANRIKQISKERSERLKKERADALKNAKLGGLKNLGAGGGGKQNEAIAKEPIPSTDNAPTTNMVGGAMIKLENGSHSGYDAGQSVTTDVMSKATSNNKHWGRQAMVSQDAFTRPVSRKGDGGLPRYYASTGIACDLKEAHSSQPMGPINEWNAPVVNNEYLDPFATPTTPKHANNPNDENFHHDVNSVAWGETAPSGASGTLNLVELGDVTKQVEGTKYFPEDFRMMATKGPILMHSWGYDLQGKPVPNMADSENDTKNGVFKKTDLTDKFLDHYLRKPSTWPVAPVDLRLDRERGVWTVPNSFRIIQVDATGYIETGTAGEANVLNGGAIYDDGGGFVNDPTIDLSVPSWAETGVSGSTFAFFDTLDCKWYPLGLSAGSGGGGSGTNIAANTYCGGAGNTIIDTQLDLITFDHGLYVSADVGTNSYMVKNDLRFEGNRFYNITLGSGLDYEQYDSCNYRINAISTGTKIAANTYCGGRGNTIIDTELNLITFEHGFNVTADTEPDSYKVDSDLRFDGNIFYNIVPRSGLKVTPFGNCEFYLDATGVGGGSGVLVEAQNTCSSESAISESEANKLIFGGTMDVSSSVAGTYVVNTIHTIDSNAVADLAIGSGLRLTAKAGAGCDYQLDSTYCPPVVNGAGTATVTSETNGFCTTYTVSGECAPEITTGKNGSTTVSKTTSAGCDIYTVSGDCLPVVQGAGGVSVSSSVSAGCTTYTVSGCDVNVTAGTGISIVESDAGCSFEVNADPACNTEVTVSDTCLILNKTTAGCKDTYDIDIDDSCKLDWEAPNWSLCGSAVNKNDNITFTNGGCATVTCNGAAKTIDVTVPCTTISAGSCISVSSGGTNSFTIGLTGGSAGTVQVVKDICCAGTGLNVVYTTLNFNSCGLFTGETDTGSC